MKIGVLTDTHAMSFAEIPGKMKEALSKVDLIVHAGDFVSIDILNGLRNLKEVKAVHGNMDFLDVKSTLPAKEIFTVQGKRFGIIHGSGGPEGIEQRIKGMFEDMDVIVYGHSHRRRNKIIDGILFFNPGPCHNSFGLVIVDKEVKAEIVDLE